MLNHSWLQALTPVILTLCAIWLLRALYLWQREPSFRRRERRRKEHPAVKLDIPAGVKRHDEYAGAKSLHEAQRVYLERAVEAQGKYFASGIVTAVLPPLALFLLTLQLLAPRAGGSWAIRLIVSEALCLGFLVYLALTHREPTAEWIENRVRIELLRREQYLALAGVGPYLAKGDSECAQTVLERRGQIEGADARALVGLVPMQERSGLTWMEALHRSASGKSIARPDSIDRMESYLYYRIGKQLLWFANELRDCDENEELWSRLLVGALLAAIAVAVLHAFHLNAAGLASDAAHQSGYWETLIRALAIALPPLGTACVGIRAMYNSAGRSRVYGHEKALLHAHKGNLEALILQAKRLPNCRRIEDGNAGVGWG